MKKVITFIMSLLLTFTVGYANEPIKVFLDGNRLSFDQPPIIENGRTLVPMRMIFESMGADVTWNDSTQSIIAETSDMTIVIAVKGGFAVINGDYHTLDVPAKILNGRTLVPVRFIAESLGCNVDWIEETQTVFISKKIISPNRILDLPNATIPTPKIDTEKALYEIEKDKLIEAAQQEIDNVYVEAEKIYTDTLRLEIEKAYSIYKIDPYAEIDSFAAANAKRQVDALMPTLRLIAERTKTEYIANELERIASALEKSIEDLERN